VLRSSKINRPPTGVTSNSEANELLSGMLGRLGAGAALSRNLVTLGSATAQLDCVFIVNTLFVRNELVVVRMLKIVMNEDLMSPRLIWEIRSA
jgi:hypothetical protein